MDDSFECIDLFSGVATSRDSNGYTNPVSVSGALPYKVYTLRDTIIPSVRS